MVKLNNNNIFSLYGLIQYLLLANLIINNIKFTIPGNKIPTLFRFLHTTGVTSCNICKLSNAVSSILESLCLPQCGPLSVSSKQIVFTSNERSSSRNNGTDLKKSSSGLHNDCNANQWVSGQLTPSP